MVKLPTIGTKMKQYINKIIHDDALNFSSKLKPNSIDIILTDPPYFLNKMDNNWSTQKVKSPML